MHLLRVEDTRLAGTTWPREDGSNNAGSIKVKTNCSAVLGERGDIRYSIYAGNFGNAFAISAGTGLITVKSKLDRETRYKFVYNMFSK